MLPTVVAFAIAAAPATGARPPALAADTIRIEVAGEHTRFAEDALEPWTLGTLRLALAGGAGTVALAGHAARRFERSGVQVELDAYPRLGEKAYAYLNVGVSGAEIFPGRRFGAELFGTVAPGLEASAGARHLRFDDARVTLWTGSLGLYRGAWWIAGRPFLQTGDGPGSLSLLLQARRYGEEGWVGARVGFGAGTAEFATEGELDRTGAVAAALEGRRALSSGLLGSWSVGWEREDLGADRTRNRWVVGLGLAVTLADR